MAAVGKNKEPLVSKLELIIQSLGGILLVKAHLWNARNVRGYHR